jgi:hypothetical protein
MSDNINKEFFMADIALESDQVRKDGKVIVIRKGTIQLLDEWVRGRFGLPDPVPFNGAIAAFKEVRRLRQRPAHTVDDDRFDQDYYHQQRELIVRAYKAVRLLRLLLENCPEVRGYEVPEVLRKGKIWTM